MHKAKNKARGNEAIMTNETGLASKAVDVTRATEAKEDDSTNVN